MQFSTLNDLKYALDSVANMRGFSEDNPVIVAFSNTATNNKTIRFSVSFEEPDKNTTPINMVWYVKNPASAQYSFLLQRVSLTPSGGHQSTWSAIYDLPTALQEQYWETPEPDGQKASDHADTIGNPHLLDANDIGAISKFGGKLEGALEARTLATGEDYAATEVVARSWVDGKLSSIQSTVAMTTMFFSNINAQLNSVRTRLQTVEAAILGFKGFVYETIDAIQTWSINHNLNTTSLVIDVHEGNMQVIPASVYITDANNVTIEFAEPVAGSAKLLPVVT